MAIATMNVIEKEIIKKETVKVNESVTLVLTPLEAFALNNLLLTVGGLPDGARGLLDDVSYSLDKIGFKIDCMNNYNFHRSTLKESSTSVYFTDNSRKLLEDKLKEMKIAN